MKAKTRKAAPRPDASNLNQKPIDERERLYELLLKWSKPSFWEDFAGRGADAAKLHWQTEDFRNAADRLPETFLRESEGLLANANQKVTLYQDEIAEIEKLLGKLRPDLTAEFVKAMKMLVASDSAKTAERIERILDKFMEVNATAEPSTIAPPMTPNQRLVFDLLDALRPGEAMTGAEIIGALKAEKAIEQSTLTSRIIPVLKQHYSVKTKRGAGYYIEKTA